MNKKMKIKYIKEKMSKQNIIEIIIIGYMVLMVSGFFNLFTSVTDVSTQFLFYLYMNSMYMILFLAVIPYFFRKRWGIDLFVGDKKDEI